MNRFADKNKICVFIRTAIANRHFMVAVNIVGIHRNSCHHKVPVSNGGSDEYANLILVSKAVHILIHASSELTIEKYLKSLNLDNKQIEKLNKLRIMAEMPPIIL